MIVVASTLDVYGPFKDANEALEWIREAREMVSVDSLPLVMHCLTGPERFGDKWKREPMTPTNWRGEPTTLEAMDREMGYRRRGGFEPIGDAAARVVESLTVGGGDGGKSE